MPTYPEYTTDVIYDGSSRRQFDTCTVTLDTSSIRFETTDFVKEVDLEDIFDVRLGQPPLSVAGEFNAKTLTIGVRVSASEADREQDFFFLESGEPEIDSFGNALYRTVLNGTELAVRHPTVIGGRRTNSAFTIGTLHVGDRRVGFKEIDVPFAVDIDSIIDFSTNEQELMGETRDVIEVTYVKNGRSIVFETAIGQERKHNILGRYLRLEYSKVLRELSNIEISTAEAKALAVLYSMHGEATLQSLLNGRSESSIEVLKFLQKRGLVNGSEGYVQLTPKGWIIISNYLQQSEGRDRQSRSEKLTA